MKLFVHIPKTAGTSFRWALNKYFTKSQVIRDYGSDAPETSDVVWEHLYAAGRATGIDELIKEISGNHAKIVVGHFPLQKYARYFKPRDIISFVRDPLIRVCSEYLHRTKNNSFSGTFAEFVQMPAFQNMQSKFLEGLSIDSVIGITQHYEESLQRINSAFDWNLKARKKNVARKKGGRRFADRLTAQERNLFYKINGQDTELYQKELQRFIAQAHKTGKKMA